MSKKEIDIGALLSKVEKILKNGAGSTEFAVTYVQMYRVLKDLQSKNIKSLERWL